MAGQPMPLSSSMCNVSAPEVGRDRGSLPKDPQQPPGRWSDRPLNKHLSTLQILTHVILRVFL